MLLMRLQSFFLLIYGVLLQFFSPQKQTPFFSRFLDVRLSRMMEITLENGKQLNFSGSYCCSFQEKWSCVLKLLDDIKSGGQDIPGFVSRRPNAHPDMMYVGNGPAASTRDIVFGWKYNLPPCRLYYSPSYSQNLYLIMYYRFAHL